MSEKLLTNSWNGNPVTLQPTDIVNMPQAPNGDMVLQFVNFSDTSNGTIEVYDGAKKIDVPDVIQRGMKAPYLLKYNWKSNNCTIRNTSQGTNVPIVVEMIGPAMPHPWWMVKQFYPPASGNLAPEQVANGSAMAHPCTLRLVTSQDYQLIVTYDGNKVSAQYLNVKDPEFVPTCAWAQSTDDSHIDVDLGGMGESLWIANLSPWRAGPVTWTVF